MPLERADRTVRPVMYARSVETAGTLQRELRHEEWDEVAVGA